MAYQRINPQVLVQRCLVEKAPLRVVAREIGCSYAGARKVMAKIKTAMENLPEFIENNDSFVDGYRFIPEANELHIRFRLKPGYYVFACTEELYKQFKDAPKKGTFFTNIIRPMGELRKEA